MGRVDIELLVAGPAGKTESVRLLLDSGAKYSLLPNEVWQRLEIESKRQLTFVLRDGAQVVRRVADAQFRYDDIDAWSRVILGEPGDEAILGSITLLALGLVLNPFSRTLHPARMMLA